jgi:hypothetical protein
MGMQFAHDPNAPRVVVRGIAATFPKIINLSVMFWISGCRFSWLLSLLSAVDIGLKDVPPLRTIKEETVNA